MWIGLLAWAFFGAAFGDETSDSEYPEVPADEAPIQVTVEQAEFNRLSEELERLSQRSAWSGVERTYAALTATGIPLGFEHHLAGAHSARAAGNVKALRMRLIWALQSRDDDEIVRHWVDDLDANYGRVVLLGDAGRIDLEAQAMPFAPDQQAAVRFAIATVAETGSFDGYLPFGDYFFGGIEVQVEKSHIPNIDLQGERRRRRPHAPRDQQTPP